MGKAGRLTTSYWEAAAFRKKTSFGQEGEAGLLGGEWGAVPLGHSSRQQLQTEAGRLAAGHSQRRHPDRQGSEQLAWML